MKIMKSIEEVSDEGLLSLIGQRVTFFCVNYVYTGTMNGVNDVQVKLDDASIVYETGPFNTKDWKDAQKIPNSVYIRLSAVESYSVMK